MKKKIQQPKTESPDVLIKRVMERMMEPVRRHVAEITKWATTQPPFKPCPHGGAQHKLDLEATAKASWQAGKPSIVYSLCPYCKEQQADKKTAQWLTRCGVPNNLLHSRLRNWRPRCERDNHTLETCLRFANFKLPKPMLVLYGNVGNGKTHLSAGIMAESRMESLMIRQRDFISQLRRRYNEKSATDIVERCKNVTLLVLDELEIPSGGRDELPALQEVFTHRFDDADPSYGKSQRLLTIFTTNLTLDQLLEIFGERIMDRMRQAAYFCELTGDSMRG